MDVCLRHNNNALLDYNIPLDNNNALWYGLPEEQTGKLQRGLNTAARLLTGSYKYDHIYITLILI